MDGPFLADSFTLCPEAAAIARYLLLEDEKRAFPFAKDARIAYLLQQPALFLKGEPAAALIATATVQGTHRLAWPFLLARFAQPDIPNPDPLDFVVYLDAAQWQARGHNPERGHSSYPIEREALIYHELSHLRHLQTPDGEPRYHDDGRAMLALRSHTYEYFDTELLRYGPITLDLAQAGIDFAAGARAEQARTRPQIRRVK